ncbi:hypothetical protein OBBRIDRAFT_837546 [Obba rivulosa]|uniref:Ricin B lectin domain-containing protein n=1 Tax=Obba rivulosa TaxID=1052685 RepID=A0A8E2AXG4_9APHY|nr:hypothetical protein OBBRIDRAFT_837546 [Obba rivulosa]
MSSLSNGTYFIEARQQGTVLELTGGDPGTILTTWSFSGDESQQWTVEVDGDLSRCRVSSVLYPSMYVSLPPNQSNPSGNVFIKSNPEPFDWFLKSANGGYIFSADPAVVSAWNVEGGFASDDNNVINYPLDSLLDNSVWFLNSTVLLSQSPASFDSASIVITNGASTAISSAASSAIVNAVPSTTANAASNLIASEVPTTAPNGALTPIAEASSSIANMNSISLAIGASTSIDGEASWLRTLPASTGTSSAAISTSTPLAPANSAVPATPSIMSTPRPTTISTAVVVGLTAAGVVLVLIVVAFISWRKSWCCFRIRNPKPPSPFTISPFPSENASFGTNNTAQASPHSLAYTSVVLDYANPFSDAEMPELPPYPADQPQAPWTDTRRCVETDNMYKYI